MRDIFPLMIVSILLSYLLWPLVNFVERRILFVLPFKSRSVAVIITFLLLLILFVMMVLLIAPVLINQIAESGHNIPQFIAEVDARMADFLSKPIVIDGTPLTIDGEPIVPLEQLGGNSEDGDIDSLVQLENFDIFQLLGTFIGSISGLTGPAFSILGGALDVVINMVFLVAIVFYMTRDGDFFIAQIINVVPAAYRGDIRRLFYELGQIWNAYFRGQLILSVIVGLAVYFSALVIGLPGAPILGLISAFLEFVPNLGPFIALVPAAIIALLSDSTTIPFLSAVPFALLVIFIWTAIQNIEAVFLVPRVMGGQLNLHPVVVIIAVIAGASIAGALGVILAAPFTASVRLITQYIYGKIFDINPFPVSRRDHSQPKPDITVRFYMAIRQLLFGKLSSTVLSEGTIVQQSVANKHEEEILS
jgi:predicted PurR-regulated permease PerM